MPSSEDVVGVESFLYKVWERVWVWVWLWVLGRVWAVGEGENVCVAALSAILLRR